jgi:SHAQKYF class myb-like DNA-binding protein
VEVGETGLHPSDPRWGAAGGPAGVDVGCWRGERSSLSVSQEESSTTLEAERERERERESVGDSRALFRFGGPLSVSARCPWWCSQQMESSRRDRESGGGGSVKSTGGSTLSSLAAIADAKYKAAEQATRGSHARQERHEQQGPISQGGGGAVLQMHSMPGGPAGRSGVGPVGMPQQVPMPHQFHAPMGRGGGGGPMPGGQYPPMKSGLGGGPSHFYGMPGTGHWGAPMAAFSHMRPQASPMNHAPLPPRAHAPPGLPPRGAVGGVFPPAQKEAHVQAMEDQMSPSQRRAIQEISQLRSLGGGKRGGGAGERKSHGSAGSAASSFSGSGGDTPDRRHESQDADGGEEGGWSGDDIEGGEEGSTSYKSQATLGQLAAQVQAQAQAYGGNEFGPVEEADEGDEDMPRVCPAGSEQTGRWTKMEHELFLRALKKFGKEWKRVAAMVGTRTVVQTRTHAQKYFQKLQKAISGGHFDGGEMDVSLSDTIAVAEAHCAAKKRERERQGFIAGMHKKLRENEGQQGGQVAFAEDRRHTPSPPPHSMAAGWTLMQAEGKAGAYRQMPVRTGGPAMGSGSSFPPPPNHHQQQQQQRRDLHIHTSREATRKQQHASGPPRPLPSPAATGSRKQTELDVAHLLASAAGGRDSFMGGGGRSSSSAGLRISNPDSLSHGDQRSRAGASAAGSSGGSAIRTFFDAPATPWDGEVRQLERSQGDGRQQGSQQQASNSSDAHASGVMKESPPMQRSDLHQLIIQGEAKAVIGLLNEVASMQEREEREWGRKGGSGGGSPRKNQLRTLVNQVDRYGFTPIMCAASLEGDVEAVDLIVKQLLLHGADASAVDKTGTTALHWAGYAGNASTVTLLAAEGAPLNAQNQEGDTALHFSSRWAKVEAAQALVDAGAACHGIYNNQHKNALMVAADGLFKEGDEAAYRAAKLELRRIILTAEPRNRTLIVHHPECLEHHPRSDRDWECPERVETLMHGIYSSSVLMAYELEVSSDFERAGVEALARVHSAEYIRFVNDLSKKLEVEGGPTSVPFTPMVQRTLMRKNTTDLKPGEFCDTSFSSGSLRAARRAAGSVLKAVDAVVGRRNRNAFCVVRPPGHHAGPNGLLDDAVSCGFCIFNNVAVGALHALEHHRLDRVAIVDIDVHHGNGTEEIVRAFNDPQRLLFYSVHLYDKDDGSCGYEFFPGSGGSDDTAHNIINVPIKPLWKLKESVSTGTRSARKETNKEAGPASGRVAFREAISHRLVPALRAFNPQLILLSSGFDALEGDVGNAKHGDRPHFGCDLLPEDFTWATSRVQKVADICSEGRLVSALEGGYGRPQKDSSRSSRSKTPGDSSDEEAPQAPSADDLDRSGLVAAAIAHIKGLVDPYLTSDAGDASMLED